MSKRLGVVSQGKAITNIKLDWTDLGLLKDPFGVMARPMDVWIWALASVQDNKNRRHSQMEAANFTGNCFLVSLGYCFPT